MVPKLGVVLQSINTEGWTVLEEFFNAKRNQAILNILELRSDRETDLLAKGMNAVYNELLGLRDLLEIERIKKEKEVEKNG